MKDINFFLPYLEKRKVKYDNTFFLSIILLICSIFILSYTVINEFKIKKLVNEISELKSHAQNPKTLKTVEDIKTKEKDLESLRMEVQSTRELKVSIAERDKIDSDYIENIINKKPEDTFLTSLNITQESISITGISSSRLNIAEFAKNLMCIEGIGNVFISNIIKEELDYKFSLDTKAIEEEVAEENEAIEGEDEKEQEEGEDE